MNIKDWQRHIDYEKYKLSKALAERNKEDCSKAEYSFWNERVIKSMKLILEMEKKIIELSSFF